MMSNLNSIQTNDIFILIQFFLSTFLGERLSMVVMVISMPLYFFIADIIILSVLFVYGLFMSVNYNLRSLYRFISETCGSNDTNMVNDVVFELYYIVSRSFLSFVRDKVPELLNYTISNIVVYYTSPIYLFKLTVSLSALLFFIGCNRKSGFGAYWSVLLSYFNLNFLCYHMTNFGLCDYGCDPFRRVAYKCEGYYVVDEKDGASIDSLFPPHECISKSIKALPPFGEKGIFKFYNIVYIQNLGGKSVLNMYTSVILFKFRIHIMNRKFVLLDSLSETEITRLNGLIHHLMESTFSICKETTGYIKHSLDIDEIIMLIRGVGKLKFVDSKCWVAGEEEFESLLSYFVPIAGLLKTHNKLFFGSLDMGILIKSISKSLRYYKDPKYNASTMRLYKSDVCELAQRKGFSIQMRPYKGRFSDKVELAIELERKEEEEKNKGKCEVKSCSQTEVLSNENLKSFVDGLIDNNIKNHDNKVGTSTPANIESIKMVIEASCKPTYSDMVLKEAPLYETLDFKSYARNRGEELLKMEDPGLPSKVVKANVREKMKNVQDEFIMERRRKKKVFDKELFYKSVDALKQYDLCLSNQYSVLSNTVDEIKKSSVKSDAYKFKSIRPCCMDLIRDYMFQSRSSDKSSFQKKAGKEKKNDMKDFIKVMISKFMAENKRPPNREERMEMMSKSSFNNPGVNKKKKLTIFRSQLLLLSCVLLGNDESKFISKNKEVIPSLQMKDLSVTRCFLSKFQKRKSEVSRGGDIMFPKMVNVQFDIDPSKCAYSFMGLIDRIKESESEGMDKVREQIPDLDEIMLLTNKIRETTDRISEMCMDLKMNNSIL